MSIFDENPDIFDPEQEYLDDMSNIISDNVINSLTPKVEDYHLFDKLLPFAIESDEVSNDDLIVLWIFCQHFGNDTGWLEMAFFGSDFKTFYTERSEDEIEINLAYQIFVNKREPSPDEVLALLTLAVQFMKTREQYELKPYPSASPVPVFGGTQEDEPQVERDLVVKHISRLIDRFISPLKIVKCKRQWNLADKKDSFEEMSFYFFLDRFLKRYEPEIRNNVPANWQCDWPKLTKLAETLSPTTAEEAIAGLTLIYDLCHNLGLDTDPYTIDDVIGCLQKPNDREKVCQLIRNNPA